MQVSKLARKAAQPFFHVLGGDGTERYAAFDNLELVDHINTEHVAIAVAAIVEELTRAHKLELGRYFTEFNRERGARCSFLTGFFPLEDALFLPRSLT